jgi:hypothetical protein
MRRRWSISDPKRREVRGAPVGGRLAQKAPKRGLIIPDRRTDPGSNQETLGFRSFDFRGEAESIGSRRAVDEITWAERGRPIIIDLSEVL